MTLDEIEKLARDIVSEGYPQHDQEAVDMARLVRTFLPVVREAETLCGPYGIDNPPRHLEAAITTMRARLDGAE